MNAFQFWQQKIIQFFHDPPAKPFTGTPKTGKHTKVAQRLFEIFQTFNEGRKWRPIYKTADWAAAGADRPNLYTPKKKGVSGLGTVRWPNEPVITHPLSPACLLELRGDAHTEVRDIPLDGDDTVTRDLIAEQKSVAEEMANLLTDWTDPDALHAAFIVLWRRFRDDLVGAFPNDPLWQELPAESRCPDVSIWDHLKVVTALAFMKPHRFLADPNNEGAQEPWMLRVSLGPVDTFITQARTGRDLWISSFLLADLAWHAMQPVVERYGPDCIIYPDLRGNPRVDAWLSQAYPEALGSDVSSSTFAAVLPDAFIALVPRGDADSHLRRIEDLANDAREALEKRWQDLAARVRGWFEAEVTKGEFAGWQAIWDRQQGRCPIHATWVAVPWLPMGRIEDLRALGGRALPFQRRDDLDDIPAVDRKTVEKRRARLAPWLPLRTWAHYELAREVFAKSNADILQCERGFDYALTHHQLLIRHEMRDAGHAGRRVEEEPGEKCTLCGTREALRGTAGDDHRLESQRQAARTFWALRILDRDQQGTERLCAICSVKRFLVEADQRAPKDGFNRLWIGMTVEPREVRDDDDRLRVPFPSTATLAAQGFLESGLKACPDAVAAVVAICREIGLPRTSFPRALPRLAAAHRQAAGEGADFLLYEAEDVLFPEVLDGKRQGAAAKGDTDQAAALKKLGTAVAALRDAARDACGAPKTRIAVIRLDGDRMTDLLLGSDTAIATRWRDVLHPETLRRLLGEAGKAQRDHLIEAGWPALLEAKRLMGPSLHAFVSRALGHFSHRLVPWVVEREFGGRLIYAGGDDVLCLAPADEAIGLAARLQQLFSAAWVIDTDAPQDQWAWRRKDWDGRYDQDVARRRFALPLARIDAATGKPAPIRLGDAGQWLAAHAAEPDARPFQQAVNGALLPMLGTGASVSAGIAIGHYKTPLSVLLRRSQDLLQRAKAQGRRMLAIGHASRGGDKTEFTLPWTDPDREHDPAATAHARLSAVIQGFRGDPGPRSGSPLPGRLPYKLRERALSVRCAFEEIARNTDGTDETRDKAREELLRGLFYQCLDGARPAAREEALALWRRGIEIAGDQEARYTDGLLLCRELARGETTAEGDAP